MNSITINVGTVILIVGVLVILYYQMSPTKKRRQEEPKSGVIDPKNIVLVKIFDVEGGTDYGIMWNANANKNIEYKIYGGESLISSGNSTSKSNVFKIRGLTLNEGTTYRVKVGETMISIPFYPPHIDIYTISKTTNSEGSSQLSCNTDTIPTGVNAIVEGKDIECGIVIDPPGFTCDLGNSLEEPTILVYNGPNTVSLLVDFILDNRYKE